MLELSYNQLKENNKFIESEISSEINYQTLFAKQKFVHLEIKLKGQATLKNYTSIFIRTNIIPKESIKKNDTKKSQELLSRANSLSFKLVNKGIIKRKAASRTISSLARMLKS